MKNEVRPPASILTLAIVVALFVLPASVAEGQRTRRQNDLITVLESGQAIFGSFATHLDPDGAAEVAANAELDYVLYPTEHDPYDITQLRLFLQFMLDPAAIVKRARPGTDRPVIVQLPANGREMN